MVSSITGSGSDFGARQRDSHAPLTRASQEPSRPSAKETAVQEGRTVRTAADAINVLRARLDQQLQQGLRPSVGGATRSVTPDFELPSAADVAGRVLGFVQSRLQQEARAGADQERLASLLDQARAGISKGFDEAREQIKALGMMNDDLSADIDDSFSRIQGGLDELQRKMVEADRSGQPVESASASRVEASARDRLGFEVRTRDGDVITVRMDESRYAGVSRTDVSNGHSAAGQETSASLFAGSYQFSVDGELDAGEREALTALFSDVQNVAGTFFDGDIQAAFSAAKSLNMDGQELASFSLNLSSVRSVRASSYESVSSQPSAASQLRPLAGLARAVQSLGDRASENGLSGQSLGRLMDQIMTDLEARNPERLESTNDDLMNNFWKAIIDVLEPGTVDQDQPDD